MNDQLTFFFSYANFSLPRPVSLSISVIDLIYWRDVKTTAVVFTGLVVGLACLFQLSLITVISNFLLAILAFTLFVRLLCKVLHLVRIIDASHPFQWVCIYYDEPSGSHKQFQVRWFRVNWSSYPERVTLTSDHRCSLTRVQHRHKIILSS